MSGTVWGPLESTRILSEVDPLVRVGEERLLFMWRFCSGFAHGRRWPTQVLPTQEHVADLGSSDLPVRVTNSLSHALAPAWAGFHVLDRAIRSFKEAAKAQGVRVGTEPGEPS